MSAWILVWFIIFVLGTLALIAFSIGLGREVLLLGRTAKRAQDELQPMVSQISQAGGRAAAVAGNLKAPSRKQTS